MILKLSFSKCDSSLNIFFPVMPFTSRFTLFLCLGLNTRISFKALLCCESERERERERCDLCVWGMLQYTPQWKIWIPVSPGVAKP